MAVKLLTSWAHDHRPPKCSLPQTLRLELLLRTENLNTWQRSSRTETELVWLQQCPAIHTAMPSNTVIHTVSTKHDSKLCRYQVSGYGVQYRTSFVHAFITHWSVHSCSQYHMITHRHCLTNNWYHTHAHLFPFWLQWSLHYTWTTGGLWSMWERWDFLARVWDLLTWKWYATSCRNDFSTHGTLCEVTSWYRWYKGCQKPQFSYVLV